MFGLIRTQPAATKDHAACIGCSLCLLVCPVWRNSRDLALTPHGRAKALQHGASAAELAASTLSCTLCAACEPVCPEDIGLIGMVLDLRRQLGPPAGFETPPESGRPFVAPRSSSTLLIPDRALREAPDILRRIAALLNRVQVGDDDGADISTALEAGAPVAEQRLRGFLKSLRRLKKIIVADGLLLRHLRLWLPGIEVISLGETLSADAGVRRALSMGIDRATLLRSAYGAYGLGTTAPVAQAHWTHRLVPKGPSYDPGAARALLERLGWSDHDGDSVLDKNGVPLALRLNVPTTSAPRIAMATQVQEQLRHLGVRIELIRLEFPVWFERRQRGEFDVDFAAATMDPTPSGIVQSWTCAGRAGSNFAQYCDPAVDAFLEKAIYDPRGGEREWRAAYAALQNEAPAAFIASPPTLFALHRRYRGVTLRPESLYSDLWRWSVDPARRLPRDR